MTESTIEKYIAIRSDGTVNPSTNFDANKIISPFITNENNPSVTMLIGSEMIVIIGLIVWLMIASDKATNTAVTPVCHANTIGTPTLVM